VLHETTDAATTDCCSDSPSIFNLTGFIFEVGNKLKLPDEAIASASYMFQVFCDRNGLNACDLHLVGMASLHLAGKIHENIVNLGDVVNTGYSCIHRSKPPLDVCSTYWKLKDSVAQYELFLLRALNFDMKVHLPHKYLLHYLLTLSYWVDTEEWNRSKISQVGWSILCDVFRTPLCLHYNPDFIAVSVLYMSVGIVGLKIECRGARRAWWEVYCPSKTENEIQSFASKLFAVYKQEQNHNKSSTVNSTCTAPQGPH
jgi:hypothetical protein